MGFIVTLFALPFVNTILAKVSLPHLSFDIATWTGAIVVSVFVFIILEVGLGITTGKPAQKIEDVIQEGTKFCCYMKVEHVTGKDVTGGQEIKYSFYIIKPWEEEVKNHIFVRSKAILEEGEIYILTRNGIEKM